MSQAFHANLLTGEIEAGRKTVLHEIAGVLCGEKDAPCGHCLSCKRILSGQHPDIHILDPGKGSIRIEQMRDFLVEENVRPFEAPFKAYVILHAERMNPTCQNALLKTLEEPSGDTRFYLVAENTDAFLPTILSRCAKRQIAPVPKEELSRRLQSLGIRPERAWVAASLANGSWQAAQEIAGDDAFFEKGEEAVETFCRVLAGEMTALPILHTFIQKKEGALNAVDWWLMLLRDLLGTMLKREEDRYLYMRPASYDRAAAACTKRALVRLIYELEKTRQQILENVNASLAADGFFSAVLKEKKTK
ncbi:MAG: hypothetical protein IKF50_00345 [Clostridia bacterium]|nr:hypothetical protein [Clostridia bacterium]